MAVFYYPNRSAPTTTLTITALETEPKRDWDKLQSRSLTPGGTAITYDLGSEIRKVALKINNLSAADLSSLDSFIRTTVDWASATFDFTDDKGNDYNTCLFWFDNFSNVEPYYNYHSTDLLLLVGV